MKRILFPAVLILTVLLAASAVAEAATNSVAGVDLILDVRPGTLLLGKNTGKFKVSGDEGEFTVIEECGGLSTFPNVKGGVGVDTDRWYLDFTGAIGVLITDRFRSPLGNLDVCAQYKYRRNVAFGPHIGLIYFWDPEWAGSAEMDITKSSGWLGGLQVSLGYDVLFICSVDYLYAEPFDVQTYNGWIANNDEIDFSGLGVQFGIRGKF
jgi:hypothetical protein